MEPKHLKTKGFQEKSMVKYNLLGREVEEVYGSKLHTALASCDGAFFMPDLILSCFFFPLPPFFCSCFVVDFPRGGGGGGAPPTLFGGPPAGLRAPPPHVCHSL